jgi:DNA-binding transcriptional LysR family regulator
LADVTSASGEVRGLLKLNVGAVLADPLPLLIERFLAAYPAVRLELVLDDRLVDITAAGCDAGIRYGKNLAQDMIAVPIGPRLQHLALAAAPAYLDKRGTPAHPRELLQHDCIRMRFSSGMLSVWRFERGGEVLTIDPPSRLVVGIQAMAAAIDFARAGHGFVCTFKNRLDPYLQSGELTPVLEDWWQRFDGAWMYFPNRRMPAPLRAFVDLVAEERQQGARDTANIPGIA